MFDHSSPLSKFNSNEFLISVFRQLRHHHPTSPSSWLLPLAENVRVLKEHHLYVFSGFDFRSAVFRQKHLVAGRHGTWNQSAGLSSKTRTDRDYFRVEDLCFGGIWQKNSAFGLGFRGEFLDQNAVGQRNQFFQRRHCLLYARRNFTQSLSILA